MRRATFVMVVSGLAIAGSASIVRAEDKAAKPGTSRVTTTDTVQVTGRVPRPQVLAEITRITPAQHLTQLHQPLLDRVEKIIDKSPF